MGKDAPRQKLHATIFDPWPPRPPRPEPETEPEVAEDVRRRDAALSACLSAASEGGSSCGPDGADKVAMGGNSVLSDGRRDAGDTVCP